MRNKNAKIHDWQLQMEKFITEIESAIYSYLLRAPSYLSLLRLGLPESTIFLLTHTKITYYYVTARNNIKATDIYNIIKCQSHVTFIKDLNKITISLFGGSAG